MTDYWDVFICHASEDKADFVRPLADGLRRLGVAVWYDEFSLEVGDSLSTAIDRGIARSKFGIVVISKAFIGKSWANHELRGLVNRDIEEDFKILPIWHGVTKMEVRSFSPSLSDKLAIDTRKEDSQDATIKLLRIIRRDLYDAHPHAELEKMASGETARELQGAVEELRTQLFEYQCPSCGAGVVSREYIEFDQSSSGIVETFECGRSRGGWEERPCPFDPKFPRIDEYELEVAPEKDGSPTFVCYAKPRTEMARRVPLPVGMGRTEGEARDYVVEHYNYLITPSGQEFRGKWIQRSGYKKPNNAS